MNKFLREIFVFACPVILVLVSGLLLPPTPRSQSALLFSKKQKDLLLQTAQPPRLILVGGSSLSFGIDSRILEEQLKVNPVNLGIHAYLGLVFMMDSVLPYIREGDHIVLAAEYEQFYGNLAYGHEEMLRTIVDVDRFRNFRPRVGQILAMLRHLPAFSLSKLDPNEYRNIQMDDNDVYVIDAFNRYGDVSRHWNMPPETFKPYETLDGTFNKKVLAELIRFRNAIEAKNAHLHISFPGLQQASFLNVQYQIQHLENVLKENGFDLISSPQDYAMPDTFMFNTPYHLNYSGVVYRTELLVRDLRTHNP